MKNRKPLLLIGLLASSTALWAQASPAAQGINYRDTARITEVKVLTQRINQPQQVCSQAPAPQTPPPAKHGLAGAVIGGVAGGLIGHTVGRGSGKDAATAGGAVVGAMVGEHLQNQAGPAPAPVGGMSCYLVDNWIERPSGAIVSYSWQGKTFSETLPYVPSYRAGDKVPLQVSATLAGRA